MSCVSCMRVHPLPVYFCFFRWVAVIALVSVLFAAILITTSNIIEISRAASAEPPPKAPVTPTSFSLAFGAILFAFGGASTFPTIQHDMKQPTKFKYGVVVAFASKR